MVPLNWHKVVTSLEGMKLWIWLESSLPYFTHKHVLPTVINASRRRQLIVNTSCRKAP